jgi:hypothetical protein
LYFCIANQWYKTQTEIPIMYLPQSITPSAVMITLDTQTPSSIIAMTCEPPNVNTIVDPPQTQVQFKSINGVSELYLNKSGGAPLTNAMSVVCNACSNLVSTAENLLDIFASARINEDMFDKLSTSQKQQLCLFYIRQFERLVNAQKLALGNTIGINVGSGITTNGARISVENTIKNITIISQNMECNDEIKSLAQDVIKTIADIKPMPSEWRGVGMVLFGLI